MNVLLVTIGIVLLVAAVVGGGMKLAGAEFAPITSRTARLALVLLGCGSLLLGIFAGLIDTSTRQTNSSDADTAASTPAAPDPIPSSNNATVDPIWRGKLLFGSSGVDFDTDPPTVAPSITELDVYDSSGSVAAVSGKNVAKWSEQRDPSAADCESLLRTHPVSSAGFDKKSRFCVRIRESGRIVFMRFLEPQDGDWEIEATVWHTRI